MLLLKILQQRDYSVNYVLKECAENEEIFLEPHTRVAAESAS